MSKYIYTTIYEQFTGLKPPEPKNHKPRRRRGYGHPYRMRLNMQEDGQPTELLNDDNKPEEMEQQPTSFLKPPVNHPDLNKSGARKTSRTRHSSHPHAHANTSHSMHSSSLMREEIHRPETSPKITYKKRRQYDEATITPILAD